jgi:DNA mismatch repair protein MutS
MEMGPGMNLKRASGFDSPGINPNLDSITFMLIDNTTFDDLSIFHSEEEYSIFHKLNFTRTLGGRDWLIKFFSEPFSDMRRIREVQQVLECIGKQEDHWPSSISNGTIMVIERFYDTPVDTMPSEANFLNSVVYKFLHGPDFSLTRYSVGHFADFIHGFQVLISLFDRDETPLMLRNYIRRARTLLQDGSLQDLGGYTQHSRFTPVQTVRFGHLLLHKFKNAAKELIAIYGRFDAWGSMAKAVREWKLSYPRFEESERPLVRATGLYHILLPTPVSYDVTMDPSNNFLFLTGANMAGKSTFIKSVGAAVYLAHLGMGVPAKEMSLTLFDGILSNINVTDNIAKGESYFFNEVQRIKNTILKINDGKKWLVLIDELFKGTNVQDAMKCSSTVIRGLLKIPNSFFILSTHLYEIGEELRIFPNILFRYFETTVKEDQLEFSYQLKEGISNDRLGYLILKKEKVVELLEKL